MVAILQCDSKKEHSEHLWNGQDGFKYLCLGIKSIPDRLYNENGEIAGLFDVCRWWFHTYPPDIFVTAPPEIVEIRELMSKVLAKEGTYQKQNAEAEHAKKKR